MDYIVYHKYDRELITKFFFRKMRELTEGKHDMAEVCQRLNLGHGRHARTDVNIEHIEQILLDMHSVISRSIITLSSVLSHDVPEHISAAQIYPGSVLSAIQSMGPWVLGEYFREHMRQTLLLPDEPALLNLRVNDKVKEIFDD